MTPGPDPLRYPLRASHAEIVLTSAVGGPLRRYGVDGVLRDNEHESRNSPNDDE